MNFCILALYIEEGFLKFAKIKINSTMKKLIITILSLCCCISINAVSLTVSNHDKEEKVPADHVPIVVKQKPLNSDLHRGSTICIEAYYQDGHIYINFDRYVNNTNIEVTNLDTNSFISYFVNEGESIVILDISSLGCGTNYIEITINDDVFYGILDL